MEQESRNEHQLPVENRCTSDGGDLMVSQKRGMARGENQVKWVFRNTERPRRDRYINTNNLVNREFFAVEAARRAQTG